MTRFRRIDEDDIRDDERLLKIVAERKGWIQVNKGGVRVLMVPKNGASD